MSNLFKPRKNYKPFEYPEIISFTKMMNNTFWVHEEVDFTADIQDFKIKLSELEQEILKKSLLSIAQIEVAVKSFWGDLYKFFPKPEINGLGATFAECYVDGTEVLTKSGWVDFKDLKYRERVATFTHNGTISFAKPENYISKHYEGEIYKLSSEDHLAYITPKHMLTLYNEHGRQYHEEAEKVFSNPPGFIRFPVAMGVAPLNINPITDWEKLMIVLQEYGHKKYYRAANGEVKYRGASTNDYLYEIRFSSDGDKAESLGAILRYLPHVKYHHRTYKYGDVFEVFVSRDIDVRSFEWMLDNSKIDDAGWTAGLIEEICYWSSQELNFRTTSERNADIVQLIATLAGFKVRITTYIDGEGLADTAYILSFNGEEISRPISTLTKESELYSGQVHCVTIPMTHNLITRCNKNVFWAGNCEFRHSEAYSRLLEVLGYQKDFEQLLEIPVFREKLDFIESQLRDTNIINKLMFFTIVIENSSLFSQFANILSFSKFKGWMKNVANIINWTSTDEQIHAQAGIYLINKLKEEGHISQSDLFNLRSEVELYMEYEEKLLNWIFENGELDFYTKEDILNFMKKRVDMSLIELGIEPIYNITAEQYQPMKWYDEETLANSLDDFFAKRPVDYTKHSRSITGQDLF